MRNNQAAYDEYWPEPESLPDIEYDPTPTDWSWLDRQIREVRKRKEQITLASQPILRLVPLPTPKTPEKPVLTLVSTPAVEEEGPARARLTFYVQGIIELCKSHDLRSWDILPAIWSLKRTLRELRKQERG